MHFSPARNSALPARSDCELYKGNVTVTSRTSPNSLYRTNLASFTMTGYNPKDAEGFINLFALPITVPRQAAHHEDEVSEAALSEPKNDKMWGGRFDRAPDANCSTSFERSFAFRSPLAALRAGGRSSVGGRACKPRDSYRG